MPTISTQLRASSLIALFALAACSGSGTSPASVTQANLQQNVLQLAVGTANLYGDSGAGATGLNVAVTFRQPAGAFHPGDSAVFVSQPTLTVPGSLSGAVGNPDGFFSTIATGPASTETGTQAMTGTPQTSTSPSTFGIDGGAFGLGIEPWNYNNAGVPDNTAPYAQPLYDFAGDNNAFVPWGGPPAFPQVLGGPSVPSGVVGVSEGLDVFAGVSPQVGVYNLAVTVPANTGNASKNTSAQINSSALLGSFAPLSFQLDASGNGGTLNLPFPSGVTEAFVQVVDLGAPGASSSQPPNCNGASQSAPLYYTLVYKSSGAPVAPLGDAMGPGGAPSLCTSSQNSGAGADVVHVQAVGFDYPWFEASYPNSLNVPAPHLAGANGQADITISTAQSTASSGGDARTRQLMRAAFHKLLVEHKLTHHQT